MSLPIACSLGATDQQRRLQDIAALGREALIDSRVDGATARLRFAARPGVRDRVAAIAAAEAECCPFLAPAVTDEDDAVVLSVRAPDDYSAAAADFAAAFQPG